MALNLKESFSNLKLVADAALMNKDQRTAIDESLLNLATALQSEEKQAARIQELAQRVVELEAENKELKEKGESDEA